MPQVRAPFLPSHSHDAQILGRQPGRKSSSGYVGPYNQAVIWAGLGDRQQTVVSLQRAWDAGDAAMTWLRVDPRFEAVRSDPWVQSWPARLNGTKKR